MATSATAGSKLYIAVTVPTTGVIPFNVTAATDDASEYAALNWQEVKECTNLGELGDEAQIIAYNAIGENRTKKRKGTSDAGDMEVVCAMDMLGLGQTAMRTAAGLPQRCAFKLEANDKEGTQTTNSIFYWQALVVSKKMGFGEANKMVEQTYPLAITTPIVEVPVA